MFTLQTKKLLWQAWWLGVSFLLLGSSGLAQTGEAQSGGAGSPGPYEATPQRPTFTSDTSTTAPGTLELEFGTTSSGGFVALPVTLKYTPDVAGGLFHRAEFSLSFEGFTSVRVAGRHVTQFGDRLGFALRRPVYRGRAFSLALAPQAIFFLRGERGARLGATLLGVYGFGLNSVVGNASWTSTTSSSATNPAQQYDVAFDFIRALGEAGRWSRVGVFGGLLVENPSKQRAAVSLEQGISYRVQPNWVLDFAVRQTGVAAGRRDYQILAGFTLNLGRLRLR